MPDAFHVLLKPRGAICNLDCKYCFFLSKEKLFPGDSLQERSDNLLSFRTNNPEFIADLLAAFEPLNNQFVILEEEA